MSDMVNTGRAQQAGQTARQEASATAGQVKQAAGEIAGTATEQVKTVAGQAREQAGAAVRDLRERVSEQADSQAKRGAANVRQWADDLAGLAEKADSDSPAQRLIAEVAERGRRAADYVDQQGVEGLVGDVQDFARRRPGAFLGGAALTGFAVGRLAKAGSKTDGPRPGPSAQPPAAGDKSLQAAHVPPELPG
ncbi:hypothetical protein ACWD26_22250 [Streptomyces sp. NPDC002787]